MLGSENFRSIANDRELQLNCQSSHCTDARLGVKQLEVPLKAQANARVYEKGPYRTINLAVKDSAWLAAKGRKHFLQYVLQNIRH
jgi:hypothetical protein